MIKIYQTQELKKLATDSFEGENLLVCEREKGRMLVSGFFLLS